MTNIPLPRRGAKIKRYLDLQNSTLQIVKATPGCLLGMWVCNRAATTRYVKFYNAVSGVIGTGTPVLTIAIPGNASDDIGAFMGLGGIGIQFTTGICVGATSDIADAGTTAPSANDVVANIFYI